MTKELQWSDQRTLKSLLVCKEIQPVHPKDQSWVFIGGTDIEAETPILWPPDEKSWLIWKDPDAGKDCGQEEKGMTEDEMDGWHHWLNGHEFGWTLGVGDGQGGLACCSSWGRKESDTTERLNWNYTGESWWQHTLTVTEAGQRQPPKWTHLVWGGTTPGLEPRTAGVFEGPGTHSPTALRA